MTRRKLAGIAAGTIAAVMASAAWADGISTHVLDLARGVGGADVPVKLEKRQSDGSWQQLATAVTDNNGRVRSFEGVPVQRATYRLSFDMSNYQRGTQPPFFPEIDVVFQISDDTVSYHVPVVVSPFGYSTYRGN